MWKRAESREHVSKTDGNQRAHTNPNTLHQMSETQKKANPHMTTQATWYAAEGREQRASVKDRWQTKGTNKLNKLHQMSETERR